jgi:hypothetical protein
MFLMVKWYWGGSSLIWITEAQKPCLAMGEPSSFKIFSTNSPLKTTSINYAHISGPNFKHTLFYCEWSCISPQAPIYLVVADLNFSAR